MKEVVESPLVEETLDKLFAAQMKYNQEVFEGDIKDDHKPAKKSKKNLLKNSDAIE